MPSRKPEPLLPVNAFEVRIGDRELGVASVGRLSSETTIDGPSGEPAHRFATVVVRRAITTSTELYDWRRRIVEGRDDRRDVTILQRDAPGGTVVNAWRLVRAWPCRWSGPAFDGLSSDIACEELELTFDDLVWINRNAEIKGG